MRKPLLVALPLLFLISLAGCAHQSAGYAAASGGYVFDDCELEGDCYGGLDRTYASCVFVQNPAVPARLSIVLSRQQHTTRVVNRADWPGRSSADSSWDGNASTSAPSAPPPASVAPAPVAREPVILPSPAGEGRSPRTSN
jgi:hypothetical protein